MSASPQPAADRNLLFGVLALQLDYVSRDALITGMNAWAVDKAKPLGRILVDLGALPAARLALLDALVDDHLDRHGGDADASLAAVASGSTVTDAFDGVGDPAVRSTLSAAAHRFRVNAPPARDRARYQDLHFHAKGGLGWVYRAKDVELNREVALKEIKPERADEPGSRARFVREAEITGRLEHPGIIPVYDRGTHEDGRPYYAMRFVRGESLKDAIDRYHQSPAAAELRRLVGRLIDVCNAVAYAHSRGVVHRDLKPHNVMLGPFGETLVVDWGLAKSGVERPAADGDATTDPSVHPVIGTEVASSLPGSALGTPGYMSPEQAEGRHDTVGPVSDVFGLGAILYCLLTNHKPFEGTTVDDEITLTKKGQYPPPRELNRAAPAALEAVCRTALAHEPANRYPTALALAADLEKWLADEPVAVYRDPPAVRAARWARRHRTGVAAAAVLLVTATIGLSLGTALLWQEERRTRDEYDRAEREHLIAEVNFGTARDRILEMGRQVEEIETGLTDTRRADAKRKAVLNGAVAQFERFVAENPDDLVLRKQLAALHRYSGNLSRLTGDPKAAEASYQASIALWDDLIRKDPDEASHPDNLALTLGDLVTVQKRGGRLHEALKTADRSAALADEIKDRVPLAWHQRTKASALLNRADVEYRLGEYAEAERAAARAVELFDALRQAPAGQQRPNDPLFAAIAVTARGSALRELGKETEALAALDDAVGRLATLGGAKGGRDVVHNYDKARIERAVTRSAGRPADAIAELADVMRDEGKLADDFPSTSFYKEVLAEALVERGLRTVRSDPAQAAADFQQALKLTRELIDKHGQQPDHVALRGRAYYGQGLALLAAGKTADAGTAFDRAVTVYRIARDADPDNVHVRRGLERAEAAARATPKPPADQK